MERRQSDGNAVPDEGTTAVGAESWESRAEECLRDTWRFFNRKVIDLHSAGRLNEAEELSEMREQVHALLRERPQQTTTTAEAADLQHPVTQLAEGSGLPASDDPESYMPSLP